MFGVAKGFKKDCENSINGRDAPGIFSTACGGVSCGCTWHLADIDQSGIGKLFHVVGERGRRNGEFAANVATSDFRARGDPLQQFIAPRIGQGLGNAVKVGVIHGFEA